MSNSEYNGQSIDVLQGLEGVRMRPGMYIGTTSKNGLHHLLWEILDNSVDEIANGYGTTAKVVLHEDGSASVDDNGRGIPVELHQTGVSCVQVVFCELHAGGKFNNKNYAFSGGLHGVGASVVNALSRWLLVRVKKNGTVYEQRFRSYKDKDGNYHSGIPLAPCGPIGETTECNGTYVHFLPDNDVFPDIEWDFSMISNHLQDVAFMNKGSRFILEDRRYDHRDENGEPKVVEYCYEGGIVDLVKYINEGKNPIHKDVIYIEDKAGNHEMSLAIQYTDSYSETISSYVNNIPTTDGGMHEAGFKSALTRVLNDYARSRNLLKDKDNNLQGEDYREGISAVLLLKMQNVQFEGQTKGKLGNIEAKTYVESVCVEKLGAFFSEKKNFPIGDAIVNKALGAQRARLASKKAKELARKSTSAMSNPLLGKLETCTGKNPKINEIFIVEGDSAGGTAKQCRNRQIQAVLPLRGKVINAEKQREEQLLDNEEIRTIITAFGAGYGSDFNVDNLKYDKIIILADADQDGGHIRSLLITFFYRYMRPLITNGHLYIGMPPLYRLEKKDQVKYVYSDKELDIAIKEFGRNYRLQRYKGLGEMNNDQLWETTMNPETRSLTRVVLDDGAMAERMITVLMGDNVEARKEYISKNANFNKVDKFERKD